MYLINDKGETVLSFKGIKELKDIITVELPNKNVNVITLAKHNVVIQKVNDGNVLVYNIAIQYLYNHEPVNKLHNELLQSNRLHEQRSSND